MTTKNKQISVNGITYNHVRDRVQKPQIAVYVSDSGSEYMRIGPEEEIRNEQGKHEALQKEGFPVAPILSSGEAEGKFYYTEKSLGTETYFKKFSFDVATYGYITEENFATFLEMCRRVAKAQLTSRRGQGSMEDFFKGFFYDTILEEMPESRELITRAFDKVKAKLAVLPFVPTHGDLNPYNMFCEGVIDLEYFHTAPFGYDLVSALYTTYFFPKSSEFELTQHYDFSKNQRATFIYAMDRLATENGVPHFTYFTGEFILCRAVFSAVRMNHTPKLQAWRYKLLKSLLIEYLDGRRIKLPAMAESN